MGNCQDMNKKRYFSEFDYDEESGVFKFPESFNHSYSDGMDVEKNMLEILKRSKDNSIFSEELRNEIKDWVTEYHFSSDRHNLLRNFDFENKSILELGSGCGALTRYLGEKAKDVVGVEGSFLRAKCTSQRCRDLDNVKVYSSNFVQLIPENKFDYVTLIGVLEYSSRFIKSKTPFADCIKIAKSFLKKDGKLIIAIENRLGLKYFSGLSEDHTSKPYFGLYDLYKEDTGKTFGKYELMNLLNSCGLHFNEFLYPFPDYKIPTLILTEQSLSENINLSDILFRIIPRDYSNQSNNNFYDNLVWESIEKNKLIDQFSNSFLVISSKEKIVTDNNLVYHYTTNRRNKYNVSTTFKKLSNEIVVSKDYILKDISNSYNDVISHKIESNKYIYGTLLESRIEKAIVANRMEDLIEYLNIWLKFLFKNAIKVRNDDIFKSEIKNDFFDCIPRNIILNEGKLSCIDKEWSIDSKMSLYFLILRYFLFWDYKRINYINNMFSNNKSYLMNIFRKLNIQIVNSEFSRFEKFINDIHFEILGDKYQFELDKRILRKKKYFVIKKIIKKILTLIQKKIHKLVGE